MGILWKAWKVKEKLDIYLSTQKPPIFKKNLSALYFEALVFASKK